ncbi:MAG: hypothetical protein GF309_06660 [Candidatus Lokiarchaeota archaeon]|nr:hypothetical protein [Candidatus Lokiarchaeota archaeon]
MELDTWFFIGYRTHPRFTAVKKRGSNRHAPTYCKSQLGYVGLTSGVAAKVDSPEA